MTMDLNDLLAQGDDRNGRTVGDENLRLCSIHVFKTGKISSKKYLKNAYSKKPTSENLAACKKRC